MTNNDDRPRPAVTPLPVGYDDPESFWWVRPEYRDDYVRLSSAVLSDHSRRDLRRQLAAILYADAAAVWRAQEVAAYVRRHGGTEQNALRYLAGLDGRITVDAATSLQLHARCDVGGTEWPNDAEQRVEHIWRVSRSAKLAEERRREAKNAAANTCPMCQQIAPTLPSLRVSTRTPVAGLPSVSVCGVCADAIAHVHAERVANAVVDDAGTSRRDLATDFLDAHDPNAARPVIRTATDVLAAAGRTGGR